MTRPTDSGGGHGNADGNAVQVLPAAPANLPPREEVKTKAPGQPGQFATASPAAIPALISKRASFERENSL